MYRGKGPGDVACLLLFRSSDIEKGSRLMKIDVSFLAAFFLLGTDLLTRAATQGIEPALIATAVEFGSAGLMRLSKWARAVRKLCFTDRVE